MTNTNRLEKILLGIIYVGSFLVVLVPLIVIPRSYFPYIVLKTIIMRVVIEAVFVSWLILMIRKAEYRPKLTILFWVLSAFMLVWLVSTIFSQSWIRSLWGNYERMGGFFTYIHYYAWWVVLVSSIKNIKNWYRLLGFSLLISVIICLYSIGQRIGSSLTLESGITRVNGTLGNAAYLASYLLFHIFISWYFFAKAKGVPKKLLYLGVFFLQLSILTLTSTRGAFIAFIISFVLFAIASIVFRFYKEKSIRVFVIFSFLAILTGISVFVFKESSFVQKNYYFNRLTNMSMSDNTIQTRLISWQAGFKGFKDYLLIGVGPENYNIVFNKYFTPDFYTYTGSEVWFDRAHNTLVDMAAMLGLFGILNYLAIFLAVFYVFWRFVKKQGFVINITILGLLFIAYFIQNIFVFDSINSLIPFFMMLGLVDFFDRLNKNNITKIQTENKISKTSQAPIFTIIGVIIFVVLQLAINIPQVKANQYTYNAFVASRQSDYSAFIDNYNSAIETDVSPLDPTFLLVQNIIDVSIRSQDKVSQDEIKANFTAATEFAKKGIELDPKNVFNYYLLAKLYNGLAEYTRDGIYLNKALDALETCHKLSPNRIRVYWVEAQTYIIAGKYEEALKSLESSISLIDSIPDPYWFKYIIYDQLNDEDLKYQAATMAILNNYSFRSVEDIKTLLPHYVETQEFEILEKLYSRLLGFEPKNLNYVEKIVDFQIKQNKIQAAMDTVMKASKVEPGYSDRAYEIYNELKNQL